MTNDQFWDIIEQSRNGLPHPILTDDVKEKQRATLTALLKTMTPTEIAAFDAVMNTIHKQSNHWELWGVAYIIGGGCSDDGFEYFRRWLLSQGRETFEQAVRDPDGLVAILPVGDDYDLDHEEFFHVAGVVYEDRTGNELPYDVSEIGEDTRGDGWDEDDLPTRFPRTWAKFGREADADS